MEKPSGRVNMALFGLGRAGTIHLHNLLRNYRVSLKYVVDLNVQGASDLLKKLNQPEVEVLHPDQSHAVYEDKCVEAVMIATPTFTHEEIVLNSLKHGKAVFCEKPLAWDAERTLKCYEEAERVGKPLLCSLNRRFDPSIVSISKRVRDGEIGKVHVIKSCARDHPLPPAANLRDSGGIYHDCATHDIDTVCWIIGEFPVSVYAQGVAHDDVIKSMGDVDTVLINMRFPSGVLCSIDLSRHANYGYDQRVEVYGMNGMLQNENQMCTTVQSSTKSGVHSGMLDWSFPQRYAASYVNALEHFIDVIQGKDTLRVSKESVVGVSRIASACEEASHSGNPVELNIGQTWA